MAIKKKRSVFDVVNDYFPDLRKWTDDFERMIEERPSWNLKSGSMEPLRDMLVTPTEVIVTVDLPFTEASTVRVKPMNNRTLEISAKMKRKIRFDDLGITHHRGEFQAFYCQTRIPVPVDMSKLHFASKKGFLDIHLPREHERITRTK